MFRLLLLAATATVVCHGKVLQWVHDNNFATPSNWEGGEVPAEHAFVVFPEVNSDFNMRKGAGYYVSGDWKLDGIRLPMNGEIEMSLGASIEFTDEADDALVATWRAKSAVETDFKCHANWETEDGESVAMPPCHNDVAKLPAAGATQVYVETHTYLRDLWYKGVKYIDGQEFDAAKNPHHVSGASVSFEERDCESLLLDATEKDSDACSRYCVDTCPDLQPTTDLEKAKAALAVLEEEQAFFSRVAQFYTDHSEWETEQRNNAQMTALSLGSSYLSGYNAHDAPAESAYRHVRGCLGSDSVCNASLAFPSAGYVDDNLGYRVSADNSLSKYFNPWNATLWASYGLLGMSSASVAQACTERFGVTPKTYADATDWSADYDRFLPSAGLAAVQAYCLVLVDETGRRFFQQHLENAFADTALLSNVLAYFPIDFTFDVSVSLDADVLPGFTVAVALGARTYEPFSSVYSARLFNGILSPALMIQQNGVIVDLFSSSAAFDPVDADTGVTIEATPAADVDLYTDIYRRYGAVGNPATVSSTTLVLRPLVPISGSPQVTGLSAFEWVTDDHIVFDNWKGEYLSQHQAQFDQHFRAELQQYVLGTVDRATVTYTGPLNASSYGPRDLAGYEVDIRIAVDMAIVQNGAAMYGPSALSGWASIAFSRALARITADGLEAEVAAVNQKISDLTRTPASSESDEDGLPVVLIAAGAGGGLLLLLIIVILVVVLRRKQDGQPRASKSKPSSDRTVVAFENPMYDDPAQSNPTGLYEGGGEADEGLYDEPAFNASGDKSNPMYHSTEDLGGVGLLEDEGGYLDMEETGYLDVAPEE